MIFKQPECVGDFADSRFERFEDKRMASPLVYGAQGFDFAVVMARYHAIAIRHEKLFKQSFRYSWHIAGNKQVSL